MRMTMWVIQGIGFLGVAFFLMSYQVRSNKSLFLMQMIGCALFALQYILLGAATGCACLIITMIRNAVLLKRNEWKWVGSIAMPAAMILALGVATVMTWSGPTSLLLFIGVSASSIAYWSNDAMKIRMSQLTLNSPCGLIYDMISGSWAGVITESLSLLSILISLLRFGHRRLGESA